MIRKNRASGMISMDNGKIRLELPFQKGRYSRQIVSVRSGRTGRKVADSDSILLLRQGGYGGLVNLGFSSAEIVRNSPDEGILCLRGGFEHWSYRVTFFLSAGMSCIEGVVHAKPRFSQVGWLCYGLSLPKRTECWAYPWVMSDHYRLPTNIGREIGVTRPNQIWAKLAGVPAITWRSGDFHGLVGFPLQYDYGNSSLTCNPETPNGVRISLGWGLVRGFNIEDANEEYGAGRECTFPFQIMAGSRGFAALAREWVGVNRFSFDTTPKYTVKQITEIMVDGRRHEQCHGQRRYVSRRKTGKYVVSGYQSGGDDNRIIVDLLPRHACVDYELHRRTGDAFWLERVYDQMRFLGQCQDREGWLWENWDLDKGGFFFQGIEEFGPRTDRNAHCCEYILKLIRMLERDHQPVPEEWMAILQRCLSWINTLICRDGSFPMTVVPKRFSRARVSGTSAGYTSGIPGYADPGKAVRNAPSPQTRLLAAFLELERHLGDPRLARVRKAHEAWVVKNAFQKQKWWGHWNDTGHTATGFSAMKFIEYCVRAYELLKETRYLDMAAETASWAFFQHVPKQLEWCRQYTRGAMIEQDNYMQYGNDMGDNLIFQALIKLGKYTRDPFFTDMGLQSITTAMMTFNDDPRHPWHGSWNTYIADSTGLTVPFDTDPVTGTATHYSICSGLLDLWSLPAVPATRHLME